MEIKAEDIPIIKEAMDIRSGDIDTQITIWGSMTEVELEEILHLDSTE
jgi:hypothetical protein